MPRLSLHRLANLVPVAVTCVVAATALGMAQRPAGRVAALGDGPWVFGTAAGPIRVVVVTKGITHPWSLAFLPDGNVLVTERAGALRIIRNGVLDPQSVSGVPKVETGSLAGLMDIALHPRFAENQLVYLTYSKGGDMPQEGSSLGERCVDGVVAGDPVPGVTMPCFGGSTTALACGRFDGKTLSDVRDIFVADAWGSTRGNYGSRVAFGPDGMLYMTIGDRVISRRAQDPTQHAGTIVRLRDDGSVPPDNPFAGRAGYRPEIYAYGFRNQQGLAFDPVRGVLWEHEFGPNGGDELNQILPGRNYGWPLVTLGRNYDGSRIDGSLAWREGMEPPVLFWVPAISPSGLAVYTGDKFPRWKGNLFVGGMMTGRAPGTGHLERLVFSDKTGGEMLRESLLPELKQRIREVRQGPDGYLYLLTDEAAGALMRIEPDQP